MKYLDKTTSKNSDGKVFSTTATIEITDDEIEVLNILLSEKLLNDKSLIDLDSKEINDENEHLFDEDMFWHLRAKIDKLKLCIEQDYKNREF